MIKYIKENIDSISKLFINHVGMMIFGLAVLISTKLMNDVVFYMMGVLAVLMYFTLLYTAMWERGAKDKIKIDGGRKKPDLFHGLWAYLLGNILVVITSLLGLIFAFFVTEEVSFANNTLAVFRFISHYYNAMYLPITEIEIASPVVKSLIYVATILPGAIVSCVSYILGVKGCRCIFPESKKTKKNRYN